MTKDQLSLDDFIAQWTDTPEKNKAVFLRLKDRLATQGGVRLSFHPRPGITYSLRAAHENQTKKSLFTMIDVIEDDPRWLSVCFYGEMINDPEEKGDFVPEGLLGEDAVCFDIENDEEQAVRYVEARLDEACRSAADG